MRSVWPWILVCLCVCLGAGIMYLHETSPKAEAISGENAGPESAVTAMLVAQRDGDLQMFLNCLAGPALEEVNASIERRSPATVSSELQKVLRGMKGYAVTRRDRSAQNTAGDPDPANSGDRPDQATVDLELIFADYTVQQSLRLQRVDDVWRVTNRSEPDRLVPEIPYGTPVSPTLSDEQSTTARR